MEKKKKKKKRNRFLIAVLPISEGIDPEISFPFRFLLDDRGERKEDRKNESKNRGEKKEKMNEQSKKS